MQDKLPKTKLIAASIFMLASLGSLFFAYTLVKNKNEKFQNSQIEISSDAKRREETQQLERLMKTLEAERLLIDSHFAKSSDIVPFLDTLERMASQVAVDAEVSSVDITKDNKTLTVGIKATGGFEALYKFLVLLENSPYELSFLLMDIQTPQGAQPDPITKKVEWQGAFKVRLLSFLP